MRIDLDESQMACRGAETISTRCGHEHMEQCAACETAVRWDMVDHWFFGFQTCKHANPDSPATPKEP